MTRPRVFLERCFLKGCHHGKRCPLEGWYWEYAACKAVWTLPFYYGPFDSAAEANDDAVLHLKKEKAHA